MQITPHCFAVTGLGCIPPWTVNAGFIVGDDTTLIVDTSANAAGAATILGYAKAVRPGNRIIALNTEKHFDHIGGNSYLREQGIDIYGHPGVARTPEEFDCEIEEFNASIPNPARRAAHEADAFYAGTTLAAPSHHLTSEMKFDLCGITAEVIFTPGHTPTNVSVFVEGVLYSGDCLINVYIPNLHCGSEPEWRQWLASLDHIDRLAPRAVVAGHGPVLMDNDVTAAIARVRKFLTEALYTGLSPTATK